MIFHEIFLNPPKKLFTTYDSNQWQPMEYTPSFEKVMYFLDHKLVSSIQKRLEKNQYLLDLSRLFLLHNYCTFIVCRVRNLRQKRMTSFQSNKVYNNISRLRHVKARA